MSCGRMGTTGLQLSADVSQKMSFTPQFEITNSITAELTRIERARGFLDAAKLSEDWIAGMQKRALVLEAHYTRSEEHTSELQSRLHLVCRLLLEKKKKKLEVAHLAVDQLVFVTCTVRGLYVLVSKTFVHRADSMSSFIYLLTRCTPVYTPALLL